MATESTAPRARWAPEVVERLDQPTIEALRYQQVACVVIPRFLQPEWCQELTRRFLAFIAEHPDHSIHLRPNPSIDVRLDVITYPLEFFAQDRRSNIGAYFDSVTRDRPALRALFANGPDALDLIRACWSDLGWKELPALEEGRPYQTDVLLGLRGRYVGSPHVDTSHVDVAGSLSHFTYRLNFNVCLQMPEAGGALRVYQKYKVTEDFSPETLANIPYADIRPEPGDLIIYDPLNYYEVLAMDEQRHRLMLQVAVGVDSNAREFSLFA